MGDNIKMFLNVIGCADVEWFHLMSNWTKSIFILGEGYAGQIYIYIANSNRTRRTGSEIKYADGRMGMIALCIHFMHFMKICRDRGSHTVRSVFSPEHIFS
jgi:hypothetical protein